MSVASRAVAAVSGVVLLEFASRGVALDPNPALWARVVAFVVALVYSLAVAWRALALAPPERDPRGSASTSRREDR